MAEREHALRAGGAELRAKEDEFVRSKKILEKEMEQLKKELRVDSGQTKLQGRDKELKNIEVSGWKSHVLECLLSKYLSLGSCHMFNMPQRSTYYDHHEMHA